MSEVLPFSGGAPSAEEWQKFAESFSQLDSGTVQREVSVAYWQGSCWYLAVPVTEPKTDSVEALVLRSDDGSTFSGYKYATWGEVKGGISVQRLRDLERGIRGRHAGHHRRLGSAVCR